LFCCSYLQQPFLLYRPVGYPLKDQPFPCMTYGITLRWPATVYDMLTSLIVYECT
jgi:hypothetical protein